MTSPVLLHLSMFYCPDRDSMVYLAGSSIRFDQGLEVRSGSTAQKAMLSYLRALATTLDTGAKYYYTETNTPKGATFMCKIPLASLAGQHYGQNKFLVTTDA